MVTLLGYQFYKKYNSWINSIFLYTPEKSIDALSTILSKVQEMNDGVIQAVNAYATVILVIVTSVYVYYTERILKESQNANKRRYIEKQLEKLYYPLKDFLLSPYILGLYYFNEIQNEVFNETDAQRAGIEYHRPSGSILDQMDAQDKTVHRYTIEDIIPYEHLATSKLVTQLKEFISNFRDINPDELADNEPEKFKALIDDTEEIVDRDIIDLNERHEKLLG